MHCNPIYLLQGFKRGGGRTLHRLRPPMSFQGYKLKLFFNDFCDRLNIQVNNLFINICVHLGTAAVVATANARNTFENFGAGGGGTHGFYMDYWQQACQISSQSYGGTQSVVDRLLFILQKCFVYCICTSLCKFF